MPPGFDGPGGGPAGGAPSLRPRPRVSRRGPRPPLPDASAGVCCPSCCSGAAPSPCERPCPPRRPRLRLGRLPSSAIAGRVTGRPAIRERCTHVRRIDTLGTMKRHEIPTPALVVDLAAMDRNIRTHGGLLRRADVQAAARTSRRTRRPRSPRRQLAAGSCTGLTCATVGEAEVVAASASATTSSSPMRCIGPGKAARVAALAAQRRHQGRRRLGRWRSMTCAAAARRRRRDRRRSSMSTSACRAAASRPASPPSRWPGAAARGGRRRAARHDGLRGPRRRHRGPRRARSDGGEGDGAPASARRAWCARPA